MTIPMPFPFKGTSRSAGADPQTEVATPGLGSTRPIKIALQGGGAHGAYTWGVLDRLLEDERLPIVAMSGCSAGAMNAVVLASGLAHGGREGARAALATFWRKISLDGRISDHLPMPMEGFVSVLAAFLPSAEDMSFFGMMRRMPSPYDFNPLDLNPLRDAVAGVVDFEAIQAFEGLDISVSATDVRTGKVRIFRRKELTVDVVMASACLPLLFQAVEIDGNAYWDGGYSGNPALFPLFDSTESGDIVLVQINPIERDKVPTSPREIMERINEITFNASLLREFRAIEFVNRMIAENRLDPERYRAHRLHRIGGDSGLDAFSATSKFNTRFAFLEKLRDLGRSAADDFLIAHFDDIGVAGTLDLKASIA